MGLLDIHMEMLPRQFDMSLEFMDESRVQG